MKITIGVPHYNNKKGVMETLGALIRQKRVKSSDLEIILVNDGYESRIMKDELSDFKYFDGSIKVINQDSRFGAAGARNEALKHANGNIILYIDSDAVPSEEWAYFFSRYFGLFPQLAGAGGKVIPFPQGKGLVNQYFNTTNRLATPIIKKEHIVTIFTANCCFRTKVLRKLNGFRAEIFNLKNCLPSGGEDVDLTRRMIQSGYLLSYIPEALIYHKYPSSFSSIYKKYYLYGKAMRAICTIDRINPELIGQPAPNFSGFLKYMLKALFHVKNDLLKFRREGFDIYKSLIFVIFELTRRMSHLYGFSIKRIFYEM